jgi:formate dehydrogenase subunit gamma
MATTSATDHVALVRAIAAQHTADRGALMPVLHDVMDEFGHIARDDIEAIADVLNLSVADVHGVVSFYKDFRTAPPGKHTVALCRAEACQSVGAEALYADTRARAGELGEDVEVHEVFCFGNCALGPSGMLDGRLHGRLSPERISALTEGWRS